MSDARRFYIDGRWVDPVAGHDFDVIDPATEQPIDVISLGTRRDVDRAVAAARAAFGGFSLTTREERIELFDRIIESYEAHYADIAAAISQELGAPARFARKSQAAMGAAHLSTMREILQRFPFTERRGRTCIVREPVGVCGLITPWNWPINQVACKVVPALAAGCTMVLKPSEISPLSAMWFARVLHEAGVPPGVFNLVHGDGPTVGQALAGHPDIDMVSFTGSTRAGIAVAKAAADTVKRVHQELGGKSPNIILDAGVLEDGVTGGVSECFSNTGQSCNAPTRMLVPRTLHDEARKIARDAAGRVRVGSPADERTTMGPVVSDAQFQKVQRLIRAGIDDGAELVTGGPGRPSGCPVGYFVRPTVFAGVTSDMTIAREEIFGPVLSIMPYDDEDDAIRIANDTPYGLAAYVSSSDIEAARRVAARLRAGMIHVNGGGMTLQSPFGGFKQSGNGREWGEFGLHEYLETKVVLEPGG